MREEKNYDFDSKLKQICANINATPCSTIGFYTPDEGDTQGTLFRCKLTPFSVEQEVA